MNYKGKAEEKYCPWPLCNKGKKQVVRCKLGVFLSSFYPLGIHWSGMRNSMHCKVSEGKGKTVSPSKLSRIWVAGAVDHWNFLLPSSKQRYYSNELTITWHSLWLWYCSNQKWGTMTAVSRQWERCGCENRQIDKWGWERATNSTLSSQTRNENLQRWHCSPPQVHPEEATKSLISHHKCRAESAMMST